MSAPGPSAPAAAASAASAAAAAPSPSQTPKKGKAPHAHGRVPGSAASPSGGGSPPHPHFVDDGSLMCVDCDERTTLLTSAATGKNQLRRRCDLCGSFTRGLNRACEEPKELKVGEVKKKAKINEDGVNVCRQEALKVKAHLKILERTDPAARKDYMKGEKRKRESEDHGSRRTFTDPKGFVKSTSADRSIDDEHDHYETCEEFCVRIMTLKRVPSEEMAKLMFKDALQAPGANVVMRRGEACLGKFKGVSMLKRHEDGVETGTAQSRELKDSDDLGNFNESADSIRERFLKKAPIKPYTEANIGSRKAKTRRATIY